MTVQIHSMAQGLGQGASLSTTLLVWSTGLSTQHFPLSTGPSDWDTANRLIRISDLHPSVGSPAHVSEFTYDGLWRRVEIKEKQGLQTVADRKFVWAGAEIKEERDQSNNVVKRFYGSGVQVVQGPLGGVYLYTRDHLGSVRGVLDGAGNPVAAYDYDVWGNRTQTAGTFAADFGYAGYFEHAPSGLKLTWFRGYSPLLGRWISRDPMTESGGMNLYSYLQNSPVWTVDEYGLCDNLKSDCANFLKSSVFVPDGVDLAHNAALAQGAGVGWNHPVNDVNLFWYGGKFDYAGQMGGNQGPYDVFNEQMHSLGNFNYGLMTAAGGMSLDDARAAAGLARLAHLQYGNGPYFNFPTADQDVVRGWVFYHVCIATGAYP